MAPATSVTFSTLAIAFGTRVALFTVCCSSGALIAAIVSVVLAIIALIIAIRSARRLPILFAATALAVALTSGYWSRMTTPAALANNGLDAMTASLDFVPASFAQLLPAASRSGLHHFYRVSTYSFPGSPRWEAMRYFRTGIASYLLLFCVPIAIRALNTRGRTLAR